MSFMETKYTEQTRRNQEYFDNIVKICQALGFTKAVKRLNKLKDRTKANILIEIIASLSKRIRSILNTIIACSKKFKSLHMSQSWLGASVDCGRQWANKAIGLL